jgi:hypothetical protein
VKIFIQQPGYLPWIGYFEQIYSVDTFVFFDDVQFNKRSWKTRNRIKTNNSYLWLTVPVLHANSHKLLIKDVEIDYTQRWITKHLKSIYWAYKKSKYFDEIYPLIETELKIEHKYLVDLCCRLIEKIARYLGIETIFTRSSSLNCSGVHKEKRILDICSKLNSKHLYNGANAREVLDLKYFEEAGIRVEFQDFEHPVYPQLHGEFIPFLSVIDLLFNCGPGSGQYIWGKK